MTKKTLESPPAPPFREEEQTEGESTRGGDEPRVVRMNFYVMRPVTTIHVSDQLRLHDEPGWRHDER